LPRVCTICGHPQRAEIDRAILNGTRLREISGTWNLSKSAIDRHKAHISKQIKVAETEAGLSTLAEVRKSMAELQRRVERLCTKLERKRDHRATIAAYREAREGLKAVSELLIGDDLARRLARLEGGGAREDQDEDEEAAA